VTHSPVISRRVARPIPGVPCSARLTLRGEVSGEGDFHIYGRFEGEIDVSGRVLVAEAAQVDANINAAAIVIAGKVRGNLSATTRLDILPSGVLTGTLKAGSFSAAEAPPSRARSAGARRIGPHGRGGPAMLRSAGEPLRTDPRLPPDHAGGDLGRCSCPRHRIVWGGWPLENALRDPGAIALTQARALAAQSQLRAPLRYRQRAEKAPGLITEYPRLSSVGQAAYLLGAFASPMVSTRGPVELRGGT